MSSAEQAWLDWDYRSAGATRTFEQAFKNGYFAGVADTEARLPTSDQLRRLVELWSGEVKYQPCSMATIAGQLLYAADVLDAYPISPSSGHR